MNVYVVLTEDRHCDADVEVYANCETAIERGREIAKELCRFPEDYGEAEELPLEWVFHAVYSCEGDRVTVIKTKLEGKACDGSK